jgi:hypothetical protein
VTPPFGKRIGWALLAVCCTYAPGACAQESPLIPVLSVCDALHSLERYRGKSVVIVARSGMTFEGNFMDEQCEPDARILIQGHRWPSMIEVVSGSNEAARSGAFPVDETLLRAELTKVRASVQPMDGGLNAAESIAERETQAGEARGSWIAVYGRIESPARLRQHPRPSRSHPQNFVGNGYGANGSVPARITAIRLVTLIQGPDELMFIAPWRPTQRDQPRLEQSEPPHLSLPLASPVPPPVLPTALSGPPA